MKDVQKSEIIIIGGGVVGCAIAFYLAQRGLSDIILLEKESLAGGATGICPGGIRQQFAGKSDCILAHRSVQFWDRINDILEPENPFQFEKSGYLFLAHTPRTLERFRANVKLQNEVGIPSRILDPEQVQNLLPALHCDSLMGASYCAEDGFIEDCHGVTMEFARVACDSGVRIVYEEAREIQALGSGWQVHTETNRFSCDTVIVAAGCDTASLLQPMGIQLPIQPLYRRLAFSEPYSPLILPPLVVAPDKEFAGKQLLYGVFYLGWLGEKGDEDELYFLEKALQAGSQLLPLLEELPIRRVLGGVYDSTPDNRPILGAVPGFERLYLAAGFSGHGFMIAPAVGELIAGLIADSQSDPLLDDFSIERFTRDITGEGLYI